MTNWTGWVCGCLLGVVAPAWAGVDPALLQKAEAMLRSGQAEEAYLLLEPLEVEGAGEQAFDYLLGTAALDSGRPSKATFVYERILAITPDYIGVRADMGRAYFALGDYGRAKIEFEAVLSFQNVPNDLRATVEQYVRVAQERSQSKKWSNTGYAEFGLGRDSNITSANNADRLRFPAGGGYAPGRLGDNYGTLGAGGELTYQLSDQWGAYGGLDYRGRAYERYCSNTCYWSLDGRFGLSYTGGTWSARAGVTAGQYELNKVPYLDTVGLTADWKWAVAREHQLSVGGYVTRTSYLESANMSLNTQVNMVNVTWLTSLDEGSAVASVTASLGAELGIRGRSDGDRSMRGVRVLYQKSWTPTVGGYATAGLMYSKYKGINTLYLVERDESMLDLGLGLSWAFAKGWSLRPQISRVRNASNAMLYAYEKVDGSVNVRWDF